MINCFHVLLSISTCATKRLKLKHDDLLSRFAFSFNLRHYCMTKFLHRLTTGGSTKPFATRFTKYGRAVNGGVNGGADGAASDATSGGDNASDVYKPKPSGTSAAASGLSADGVYKPASTSVVHDVIAYPEDERMRTRADYLVGTAHITQLEIDAGLTEEDIDATFMVRREPSLEPPDTPRYVPLYTRPDPPTLRNLRESPPDRGLSFSRLA